MNFARRLGYQEPVKIRYADILANTQLRDNVSAQLFSDGYTLVTSDRVRPGDEVLSPDGSTWTASARVGGNARAQEGPFRIIRRHARAMYTGTGARNEDWDGLSDTTRMLTNARAGATARDPFDSMSSIDFTQKGSMSNTNETLSRIGTMLADGAKAALAQKAISAGREYLATTFDESNPQAAAFLRSPAADAICSVLIPAAFIFGAAQLPENNMAQKLAGLLEPGLTLGAARATTTVVEKLALPMGLAMLQASGLAEQLMAPGESE